MLLMGASKKLYIGQTNCSYQIMSKEVKVTPWNGEGSTDTFAVLDDGSRRTIILPAAVQQLNLRDTPESLNLTVTKDVLQITGAAVAISISPAGQPDLMYPTFTTIEPDLDEHACPGNALKKP